MIHPIWNPVSDFAQIKRWIRIMISNPDSDSGKSNAPLVNARVNTYIRVAIMMCISR